MNRSLPEPKKIFVWGLIILLNGWTLPAYASETSVHPRYKNEFENDRVRVYEMTFEPGSQWAIRRPRHDYLIYVLEGDDFSLRHPDTTFGVTTAQAGKVLYFQGDKTPKEKLPKELQEDIGIPIAVELKSGSLQRQWKDDHYQKAENNGKNPVRILIMEFKPDSSPPL